MAIKFSANDPAKAAPDKTGKDAGARKPAVREQGVSNGASQNNDLAAADGIDLFDTSSKSGRKNNKNR